MPRTTRSARQPAAGLGLPCDGVCSGRAARGDRRSVRGVGGSVSATASTVPSLLVDRLLGRGQVPTPAAVTDMDLVPAQWGRGLPAAYLPRPEPMVARLDRVVDRVAEGDQLVVRSSLGSLGNRLEVEPPWGKAARAWLQRSESFFVQWPGLAPPEGLQAHEPGGRRRRFKEHHGIPLAQAVEGVSRV